MGGTTPAAGAAGAAHLRQHLTPLTPIRAPTLLQLEMGRLFDYAVMPLLLPVLLLWLLAARLLSLVAPLICFPLAILLNRRLVWACPFIPCIWAQRGWFVGGLMRLGFEYSYAAVRGHAGAQQGGGPGEGRPAQRSASATAVSTCDTRA